VHLAFSAMGKWVGSLAFDRRTFMNAYAAGMMIMKILLHDNTWDMHR